MTELHEPLFPPTEDAPASTAPETVAEPVAPPADTPAEQPTPGPEGTETVPAADMVNGAGAATSRWHAEAGRKGARRLQELIQEGKLYEQEHGLKRGRQRRRQLLEMGKLYEQEHGLRPVRQKTARRLSGSDRDEVLATLLRCLLRIARPSFRADLVRLIEALGQEGQDRTV